MITEHEDSQSDYLLLAGEEDDDNGVIPAEEDSSSSTTTTSSRSSISSHDLNLTRLFRLSLAAMANNAAQPMAQMIDITLLSMTAPTLEESTIRIAAFALVSGIIAFACNIFNFVTMVTMSEVGYAVGAQHWPEVSRRVKAAVLVALSTGVICGISIFVAKDALLALFAATEQVQRMAWPYFLLQLATIPPTFVSRVSLGVLGGYQYVNTVAMTSVLIGTLDVLGNYIALHVYKAGLMGSGVATLVAVVIGSILSFVVMVMSSPREMIWFPPASAQQSGCVGVISTTSVKNYVASSGNLMIRSFLLQGTVFIMYVLASRLGTDDLAAYQIILQLWRVMAYVCDGFADVGTMMGSKFLGAGQPEMVQDLTHRLLILGLIAGLLVGLVFWFAKDPIQHIFTSDEFVLDVVDSNWSMLCLVQPLLAIVFVYDGILYAFGKEGFRFVRDLISMGFILIFAPVLGFGYYHYHSVVSLWIAKNSLCLWRCGAAVLYVEVWQPYKTTPTPILVEERTEADVSSLTESLSSPSLSSSPSSPLMSSDP